MSYAQSPILIARYPLKADDKDILHQNLPLKLIHTSFEDGGVRCEGAYDDFDEGKGVGILSPTFDDLDLQNFSIRVDFKTNSLQNMPVFSVDRWYRHFVFGLTSEGKIVLNVNNNSLRKESTASYQINTWHTATLVVQKGGTVIAYLDKKEVARLSNVQLNAEGTFKDISSINFSNGACFKGWWRDLRVYNGSWTISTTEQPPKDNPVLPIDNPVKVTSLGTWKSLDFNVSGTPSTTRFNITRQFFPLKNMAGNLEIIWQDQKNQKIYLTRFGANLQNPQTLTFPSPPKTRLLAAINDEKGFYYYTITEPRADDGSSGQEHITLCKVDKNATKIAQKTYDSSKDGLDILTIGDYPSDLKYQAGTLLLFTARIMNESSDGLNHQGGIAVLFDAKTLEIIRNFGQTSGHSFDNFLTTNQNNEFIGMDLGDNYPRGINLHKVFEKDKMRSRVVYTFKTYHGTTPQSPAGQTYPKYQEISTPQKTFYKWSNDNGVYTELGGIVEVSDGYFVIFAGEPDASGKAINNARATYYGNTDARNLAYIKVRKDFEKANSLKEAILSQGKSEEGGFFTFGGRWSAQRNEGVVWLTNFKNPKTENVQYIKTLALPNGNILILYAVNELKSWENTSKLYQPYMLCLDANGKIVIPATAIDKNIALNRRDDIIRIGNRVVIVEGITNGGNKLRLHILELN